ncbi:ABC transporter ATP-binding protein [Rhodococcus sp. IEGM 248]|uniref:ABC transporter ATP-binding protein n=1 Tax=Rhodococcus TaxID=1827 RepID=UPI00076AC4B2|nr:MULTISPECIES: ATP-binding cassette domain-containing protein [Rhodococcus]KXF55573.1 ABC transporter ATP-binding protein [Rhodococcus sp. SC4]NDV03303.1 ABC transporter ATP-binding protein [Rhodococcus sp. IEGM 248]RZK86041.1 MAG: ABC transporter ATP-binding protein [Rhodococcus sp. (in: high G+C Gram-positive bacteria)]MDV7083154.1 ATP-binding cassette domain-containing protein [Rhodococcus opacus]PBC54511.1 ABC transporter ATP-binding protein [Rhodococcus sp. ACPA1]
MSHTLTIDGISKRYGEVVALDDLSFEVRPGEIFGFVGSNGAGKTTTMRIALGVLSADSGEVRLGGKPVDLDVRRTIGYMPEERGLYPKMKVGKQLEYLAELHGISRSAAREAVARWTERLGIADRVGDTVDALSLGNQQRVQLAAALVHDPAVLVLDEPFSGLDPVAVDVMSDVLVEKANTGVPVIFSSHQLELVQRLCHRVGIISHGRMRAIGTVDELRGGGKAQLEVHAPEAPVGWAHHLEGVTTISHLDGRTLLSLDTDVDDQLILHTALKTGPVHEFSLHRPTLTDLFREVVTA